MFKRIFLFILTNIAIIAMGSIIIALIERFFHIDITGTLHSSWVSLAIFAVIYGFLGAFVSLLMSRWMAKRIYHITLIDAQNLGIISSEARFVYQTVEKIASAQHISMPEVGIYESPEVNAFATGATRNSSLVAVSSGLLSQMSPDEIEGVIGHEMAHITNGDMVTMTLLQGVVNAFVIFLSRAIAHIVSLATKRDEQGSSGLVYFLVVIVLEILLGLLGSMVVLAYSRRREYAADRGSSNYVGTHKMIAALEKLRKIHEDNTHVTQPASLAALKIDGKSRGFLHLFASHPPIEARIEKLKQN